MAGRVAGNEELEQAVAVPARLALVSEVGLDVPTPGVLWQPGA
jgi:hypothetical protein